MFTFKTNYIYLLLFAIYTIQHGIVIARPNVIRSYVKHENTNVKLNTDEQFT